LDGILRTALSGRRTEVIVQCSATGAFLLGQTNRVPFNVGASGIRIEGNRWQLERVEATLRVLRNFIAIVGLAFFVLSQQAQAATLYSQPWNGTGNVLASQNDTSNGGAGNYATVYDNFTLGGNGTITQIDWTGGYFNPSTQGTIAGFTLTIYSNNAGIPGASVYSESVAGTAGETSLGTVQNNPMFSYSASANFSAIAGVEYWLSIVPDTNGVFPQWGWSAGTGGDGTSYQVFQGAPSAEQLDRAFTLDGPLTTPLPAALPLFATGLGALGLLARRRKQKQLAA